MTQMLQESRAGTEQAKDMRAGASGRAARVHGATQANFDTYSLSSRPGIQVREYSGSHSPRGSHSDQRRAESQTWGRALDA